MCIEWSKGNIPTTSDYLYGFMGSALLWYNLYSSTMQSHGFMVNPYDRCIENSTLKVKQSTIAFDRIQDSLWNNSYVLLD